MRGLEEEKTWVGDRYMDIATTRPKRHKGRLGENCEPKKNSKLR